ncbi:MAG: leucine-rich repeat protein [Oscillospiraceae bacterium]|nr:leucine-rich repeat protein [Oscillospiraceae bacterium]
MTKKKIISLLTAVAVCAGLSAPAFAEEPEAVTGTAGDAAVCEETVQAETASTDEPDTAKTDDVAEPVQIPEEEIPAEETAEDVEGIPEEDTEDSIGEAAGDEESTEETVGLVEDEAEYYASGRFGENNSLTWTLSGGRLTITGSGNMPDYIWSYEQPWDDHRSSIREIVVANGVTAIGEDAFSDCAQVTTVRINPTVELIDESAFEDCDSLTEITIPDADIGSYAFSGCRSLRKVTIQQGITGRKIGSNAFENCSALTSINLPSNIYFLGSSCFTGCSSLTTVTIPGRIKEIPYEAFYKCTALERVIINGGTVSIGGDAFRDCTALKGIRIPETVYKIGSNAFDNDISLASIALPDTSIGSQAFYGCKNLSKVTFTAGSAGRTIDYQAFYGCGRLTEAALPSNISYLGDGCFSGCAALKSIVIPASTKEIGEGAFYGCTALASVKMHDNIHTIGDEAFKNCRSLKSVTIPNANIGGNAFEYCTALTNVTIKNGSAKRTIEWHAFSHCNKLASVTIPNSVSTIGICAFEYCTSLKKAVLPEGLVIIPSSMFYGCTALSAVNIPASVQTIESSAFSSCPLRHIHIASGKKASDYIGKGSLPNNSGYYFTVTSGKCPSGNCPLGLSSSSSNNTVPAVEFDVKCVFGGRQVVFRAKGTSNQNIKIYYTTDNRSALRTTDKSVTNGGGAMFTSYGTVYARAYYNGQWGNVSRLILKIPSVNKPTLTRSKNKVTIKTTTPDAYIIYTANGSQPTLKNGRRVKGTATVTVSKGQKIRAIAVRSGYSNSGESAMTVSSVD